MSALTTALMVLCLCWPVSLASMADPPMTSHYMPEISP